MNYRVPTFLGLFVLVAVTGIAAEPSGGGAPQPVKTTFNEQPFDYRIESQEKHSGFRVLRLTYPSPVKTEIAANNTVPADYYLPDGAEHEAKRPAVLVLHILNGDFALERLLCTSLACRGIPAVMIKLPYYGERSLPGGRAELAKRPDLFAQALPQGILDARRMLDILQCRPEIDPKKLGVTGISLGGIVSATTAGADPRVNRAVLLLAGGDLLSIIEKAREGRLVKDFLQQQTPADRQKYEALIAEVDPLARAPGLRERAKAGRVLMLNAREDDVIPPACTIKLANALGIEDRVEWFAGLGHYTAIAALPQTFKKTVDFFALDLPSEVKPVAATEAPAGSPGQLVTDVARDLLAMLTTEPKPGRCHLIDLSATATDKAGKKFDGELRLIRGHGGQFRIEFKVPQLGEGIWGQDDGPWMASAKTIFRGEKQSPPTDPLGAADPRHIAKFRTVAAGVGGLLLLPGVLDQTLAVKADDRDGVKAVVLGLNDKKRSGDTIRLVFNGEQRPATATFAIGGAGGEVTFRAWQVDTVAPEELFQPPSGRTEKTVAAQDLQRIFAASFDFLMELLP